MSSEVDSLEEVEDIVKSEPMYFVLSQFLETPEGKNMAVLLEELISEIKRLNANLLAPKPDTPAASAPTESSS